MTHQVRFRRDDWELYNAALRARDTATSIYEANTADALFALAVLRLSQTRYSAAWRM